MNLGCLRCNKEFNVGDGWGKRTGGHNCPSCSGPLTHINEEQSTRTYRVKLRGMTEIIVKGKIILFNGRFPLSDENNANYFNASEVIYILDDLSIG